MKIIKGFCQSFINESWQKIGFFPFKDMQTSPSSFPQKWLYLHERCPLCWNGWKINFPIHGWFCLQFSWHTLISKRVTDKKKMYLKVAIFTWKMRKVLKRMKNRFCIFSFWDVIDFVLKFRIFFVGRWGARRPWTPRFVGAFFGCVHTYCLTGLIFIYYWK